MATITLSPELIKAMHKACHPASGAAAKTHKTKAGVHKPKKNKPISAPKMAAKAPKAGKTPKIGKDGKPKPKHENKATKASKPHKKAK